nr:MAG: hypothetical protein [Bacteriophage sp.]
MTPTTLLTSPDMYVLFDGCPTCEAKNATFLNSCRTTAQHLQRRLRVVQSGSPTAIIIRAIAKTQNKPIRYPLILLDGTIHYTPAETTHNSKETTNED